MEAHGEIYGVRFVSVKIQATRCRHREPGGEPECNGLSEWWVKIVKEHGLHLHHFKTLDSRRSSRRGGDTWQQAPRDDACRLSRKPGPIHN